jgi:hypothetical protein
MNSGRFVQSILMYSIPVHCNFSLSPVLVTLFTSVIFVKSPVILRVVSKYAVSDQHCHFETECTSTAATNQ